MRDEDKYALKIFRELLDSHNKLQLEVSDRSNIIGIFFHELMIFVTSLNLIIESKENYKTSIKFPFINTEYARNPYEIKVEKNQIAYKLKIRDILRIIRNLLYENLLRTLSLIPIKKSKSIVGITGLYHFSKFEMINLSLFAKIKVLKPNYKIQIQKKEYQLEYLKNSLSNILASKHSGFEEALANSFLNYVKTYLANSEKMIKIDLLLSPSLSILENRLYAFTLINSDKSVIACGHGVNSFLDFDEPIIGYGELSYCTDYVEYRKNRDLSKSKYVNPLFGDFPIIHYRRSKVIEKIFKNKPIRYTQINKNTKICYVPTGFSHNQRYGPFRDLEDSTYLEWQKSIMNLDFNITYKAHPGSVVQLIGNEKIDVKNLKSITGNYDIYFLDYFSTAHSILAATDKIIFFFNLGLRNMHPDMLQEFKSRVFWVDIDLIDNFENQLKRSINKFNAKEISFSNKYIQNSNPNSDLVDIVLAKITN